MAPIHFSSTGSLLLKDLDAELSPAGGVDAGAVLTAKTTLNNVTYTLSASEATLKNSRQLTGAWVSASTPVGDGVVGSVAFDLGARTSSAAVTAARNVAGMPVDLGARWAEKGSVWSLEAAVRPVKGHKVFAAVNPATGAALGSWTADLGDAITGQVAHNFARGGTTLTASRLVRGDKMVASYSLPERTAFLGWGRGPLRASIKARQAADGSFGRPSVSLSVDRGFDFDPFPAPVPPPPPPKTNPLLDNALFRRLSEIDAARLGRSIKGVAVESFSRAKAA